MAGPDGKYFRLPETRGLRANGSAAPLRVATRSTRAPWPGRALALVFHTR